jgi:hypothetical protein
MNSIPLGYNYRGYLLLCRPVALRPGTWSPRLAVSFDRGRSHLETVVTLDGAPDFPSMDAAIEHSRKAGVEWVDRRLATEARPAGVAAR